MFRSQMTVMVMVSRTARDGRKSPPKNRTRERNMGVSSLTLSQTRAEGNILQRNLAYYLLRDAKGFAFKSHVSPWIAHI